MTSLSSRQFTPPLQFRPPQSVPSDTGEHIVLESNVLPPAPSGRHKNQSKFSAGFTILFVIRSCGEFSVFQSAIRAMADRGNRVHVLFDRGLSKKYSIEDLRKGESASSGILFDWARDVSRRGTFLFHVREILSYRRYLLMPEQEQFYAERWRRYLHPFLQKCVLWLPVRFLLRTGVVGACLRLFERFASAHPNAILHIQEIHPDVVLASPTNMRYSSAELEYLKAARDMKIPNAIPVLSWDNLTNKGVFHIIPDRLFVWNETQRDEAVMYQGMAREDIRVTGAPYFDEWFVPRSPSLERKNFCAMYKLRAEDPILLYLGSSVAATIDEAGLIEWIRYALDNASNPHIRKTQVIIRPHPTHFSMYERVSGLRDVRVIPAFNILPVAIKNLQLFYDCLFHSCAAVEGANTSAVIGAIIIGRPVISILAKQNRQEHAIHFQQLMEGRVLEFVRSPAEFVDAVCLLASGVDRTEGNRKRYVRRFIRPRGFTVPAGEILSREIEEFASHNARICMKEGVITKCRVCGSRELSEVVSLGELHINAFVGDPSHKTASSPLTLVHCGGCDLVQLKHTADFRVLYTDHYWYRSALNPMIIDDLREIASLSLAIAKPASGDLFLDIGANDGTLLSFVPSSSLRVGVEPAQNLIPELKRYADVIYGVAWEDVHILPENRKAKIITAISMFYDSEDPNRFMQNVKRHLAPDGVFIAQMMTLRPMLEHNDVSNICHEHLEYYSYRALRHLFERNGLEIFRVTENNINGGSYRLFSRHLASGSIQYPEDVGEEEFIRFRNAIEKNRDDTIAFMRSEIARGKIIYGYGASTKGNTILQWSKIDSSLLAGIAEKHPEKIGKFTVGTNIPIVSEAMARAKADYFYILPWGFTNAFLEKEKEWRLKGGKFIVSIPEFRVL